MSEQASVAQGLLKEVLDAWMRRDERQAAKSAGELMFWSDGMLSELQEIEDGKGNEETFKRLKKKLAETEKSVQEAMEKLRDARNALGGSRIAAKIDRILHGQETSKDHLRCEIADIARSLHIEFGGSLELRAHALKYDIEAFNAEIRQLYRLVYES